MKDGYLQQSIELALVRLKSDDCFVSGAAVGASSILLIRPTVGTQPLKGVVVAVLVNLQKVNLEKTAMAVAACFQKTQSL